METEMLFSDFLDLQSLDYAGLEDDYPFCGYLDVPEEIEDPQVAPMNLSCPVDVYLDYLFSKGLVDSMDENIALNAECDEVGELKDHLISSVFNSYYKQAFEIEKGRTVKDNLVLSASLLLPDVSNDFSDYSSLSDSGSDIVEKSDASEGARESSVEVQTVKVKLPSAVDAAIKSGRGERARRRVSTREYKCNFTGCNKIYTKSSHLKAHIRRHTGEKPFACTWKGCNWRFSRSDELARHKRSHSGIKPFNCDLCDKRFSRSDHLAKHRKTHYRIRKNSLFVV